jgi:hypothetical protein
VTVFRGEEGDSGPGGGRGAGSSKAAESSIAAAPAVSVILAGNPRTVTVRLS